MSLICGDIHGNYDKAKAFLDYKPEVEHIFVGDYLDEWAASDQVIYDTAQMIFDSSSVTLVGNHELAYLPNAHSYMRCSGNRINPIFTELISSYLHRLQGAVVRDGFLIVHGGLSIKHGKPFDTVEEACDWINKDFYQYVNSPVVPETLSPLFDIGVGRGGWQQVSGPFWLTFGREKFDKRFNQVVGHTQGRDMRLVINGVRVLGISTLHVCTDAPQFQCFNTATRELETFIKPVGEYPIIQDLPQEEQEPFGLWLAGQTCPYIEGGSGYFPWDYDRWKRNIPIDD